MTRPLLAAALLALAGCAAATPQAPTAPAAPAAPATVAVPAVTSSVLTFVAGGRPGQSASIADAYFGGEVEATIEAEYAAASGRVCRRFVVRRKAAAEAPRTHHACLTAGAYHLVGR